MLGKNNLVLSIFLLWNFFSFVPSSAQDNKCHDPTWILSYEHKKCFKILDIFDTQAEALAACARQTTNLPSTLLRISSEGEQEFLEHLLFSTSNIVDNVWLGAKREAYATEFWWPNGDLIKNGYNNWATNNPIDTADRNCVELKSSNNRLRLNITSEQNWFNVPCTKRSLAVCQTLIESDSFEEELQKLQQEIQYLKEAVNLLKRNAVTNIRFDDVEEADILYGTGFADQKGYVITGLVNSHGYYYVDRIYRRRVEKFIDDQWSNV